MLGLVDSFFDQQLAIPWEQTMHHYWLTCLCYSYENEFLDKLIKESKIKLARKFSQKIPPDVVQVSDFP